MFRVTSPSSVYTQLIIYLKLTNSFQYRLAVQGAKAVMLHETIRNAAMLEQCCNHPKQCRNNVATPCFANLGEKRCVTILKTAARETTLTVPLRPGLYA